MKSLQLSTSLEQRLAQLYARMEESYDKVAQALDFGCAGCPDNCCDSYFQHHTYAEWLYLHRGLCQLSLEKQQEITERAIEYLRSCSIAEAQGTRPQVMCPLNEEGLCILYRHRLLVCRTHGVPAEMRCPDGRVLRFPGCFRCQELVEQRREQDLEIPVMPRTALFVELVEIENELLDFRRHLYPKVNLTIAEMIVRGEPAPF